MEPNKNKSNSLDMLSKLEEIKHEYEINKKKQELQQQQTIQYERERKERKEKRQLRTITFLSIFALWPGVVYSLILYFSGKGPSKGYFSSMLKGVGLYFLIALIIGIIIAVSSGEFQATNILTNL